MKIEQVAELCHSLNKAYCHQIGDHSQPSWKDAPEWQKKSAIDGVKFHLKDPSAPASASHENWLKMKREDGWQWGSVKDPEKKLHPCMVEFENLPDNQKVKDMLFKGLVNSLHDIISHEALA